MVDIIIPIYNSSESLIETLASIAIQRIKDKVKVYIIDDCSSEDYTDVLSLYKDVLNINYFKLDKNMGPGFARQFGLDHSDGEYIVFVDADDQLYSCYSLEILYNAIINNKMDLVMGCYYIEEDKDRFLADESYINGCLHGKIYRRNHLIKNNIRFNNSRYSEDNSFNSLASLTTNKTLLIDEIVYVYKNNDKSLTRNKKECEKVYSSYLHNMLWLINNLEERKVKKEIIIDVLLSSYSYMFKTSTMIKFNRLYTYCVRYEEKYKKYEKYISDEQLYAYISNHIKSDVSMKKTVLDSFKEFRRRFEKN